MYTLQRETVRQIYRQTDRDRGPNGMVRTAQELITDTYRAKRICALAGGGKCTAGMWRTRLA